MPINLSAFSFSFAQHRQKNVIFIHFPKDTTLLRQLRTAIKVRWSQSQKAWYCLDMPQYRKLLGLSVADDLLPALNQIHPNNQQAYRSMHEQLILKGYSENTIRTYLNEFLQLLFLLKHHPVQELTPDRLKSYMLYCHKKLRLSTNTLHSRLNALKFYFEKVLYREQFFYEIPRPKKESSLPKLLSTYDIKRMFDNITNPKHKLMLQLVYVMGLRVSEIVKLKISDIDSKRMHVLIESAKGKKDRYVPLPKSILTDLRKYYKQYKPSVYLFEGQTGQQYHVRSVQAVFKQAMDKANIKKPIGIHGLRHSYATHLLESGTDISYIQQILGHKDIKTTLIYTHVSNKDLVKINSPLDNL